MPTWKLEIVKTGETTRNEEIFAQTYSKKTKKEYFRNLNIKDLNDNKKFWKKTKPFSSDKGLETNHIILKEKTNYSLIVLLLVIYSIIILSTLQVLWN